MKSLWKIPNVLILGALSLGFLLWPATAGAAWVDITPGPALKNWTRIPIPPIDGVKPYNQWSVRHGELVCDGKGQHEWLRYDKLLADFVLEVQWKARARNGKYNSGIGVRMSRYGEIWHQAQTSPKGGYWFGVTLIDGFLQRISLRKQMTENRNKPAGRWNDFEIRCQGGTLTLRVNGAVVNTWHDNLIRKGYIGLEGEEYEIHFRNLKLKILP